MFTTLTATRFRLYGAKGTSSRDIVNGAHESNCPMIAAAPDMLEALP